MKKTLAIALVLCLALSLFAQGKQEAPATAAAPDWKAKGTPMADPRVRQALRLAIDMDTIVETVFEGKAAVATSNSSPGAWIAEDLEPYSYNPEKAKALLKEAQWPADYTIDVVYYYGDQQTVDLMAVIQQYWAAVGVKSAFRKLEGDLNAQLWVPPEDKVNGPSAVKWDMAYAAVAALTEFEFYNRFSSQASNNSSLPKDEELDALILAANATADVAEQQALLKDVQRLMNKKMYNIPLYHQLTFIYVSDTLDLHGGKLGNDQFSYDSNILNWTTTNKDGMIYSNGGPTEFFWFPAVNPGLMMYEDLVFDRLIQADENLTPKQGLLAKEYSASADGLKFEFVLRDDVKWHDGEKLTAEDVRFTIEYLLQIPGLNAVALDTFKKIDGAQDFLDKKADHMSGIAIDGDKITITFAALDPNAMMTFSQWPILPKHLLEGSNPITAQQNAFWQHPIGTGPFKVAETVLANYCILERNPDYFIKGTGNINKIYLHASSENDANLLKNAEAGKIDYAWNKNVADAEGIGKLPNMKVIPVNIRYTRLFYVNQFPHPANIK